MWPEKPARDRVNEPRSWNGNTYLHQLCLEDAPAELIREAVLELGADMAALNNDQVPPLGLAVRYGNLKSLQALLDLGAGQYFDTGKGRHFSAPAQAVFHGQKGALDMLLAHGGGRHVNLPGTFQADRDEATCLGIAVRGRQENLVAPLAAAGALFNCEYAVAFERHTPLTQAAGEGVTGMVEALVRAGADLNYRLSGNGRTALHCAVAGNNLQTVRRLLELGADPDIRAADGRTPLMLAVGMSNCALAEALLQGGAQVDRRSGDEYVNTALHQAAARGEYDLVNILLRAGADPLLTDAFNRTARRCADAASWRGAAKRLEEAEDAAVRRFFDKKGPGPL